ncbi:MAG: hypothetical protein KGH64_05380 [Candidatus Micrarchaeota archaeon]|nr:hypothetical protein [Candidatus Micrarchaeota archaeon]MDE1834740.1 hypothetical protein [Candidatus Micrarchaeota archaeon]
MKLRKEHYLLVFLAAGLSLFLYEQITLAKLVVLLAGILLFNILLQFKKLQFRALLILLCLAYVTTFASFGANLLSQSVFLGMTSEIITWKFRKWPKDLVLERRRDILHILVGTALMLILYFKGANFGGFVLIFTLLLGISAITFAENTKKNKISQWLYNLERTGSQFGAGAIWLGLGSIVTVAFLPAPYIISVFGAVFVGDPLATFMGLKYPIMKLPYNKAKSLGGSVVYLFATFLMAFPIIGNYALPLALVAAAVESLDIPLDDNLSVPIVLIILIAIARHALALGY